MVRSVCGIVSVSRGALSIDVFMETNGDYLSYVQCVLVNRIGRCWVIQVL